MKKREKVEWLEAIRELERHYGKYFPGEIPPSYSDVNPKDCPLCVVCSYHCTICLWNILGEGRCVDEDYESDIGEERLSRLKWWKEEIKEIK